MRLFAEFFWIFKIMTKLADPTCHSPLDTEGRDGVRCHERAHIPRLVYIERDCKHVEGFGAVIALLQHTMMMM